MTKLNFLQINCVVLCCSVLFCVVLQCCVAVLCCVMVCRGVVCCGVVWCVLFCCVLLSYVVSHCVVLCCTVLCCNHFISMIFSNFSGNWSCLTWSSRWMGWKTCYSTYKHYSTLASMYNTCMGMLFWKLFSCIVIFFLSARLSVSHYYFTNKKNTN